MFEIDITHWDFTFFIEVIGTIAFAASGSFAAMQNRLDPFGVLIIAFVTAVGGGTIRDLLLGVNVFWMTDIITFLVIFFVAVSAMIFRSIEGKFKNTLFMFDSFGLGLFTVIGVQKGLVAGYNPLICITLGTITGCFGGVLRDILINRIPLLLREEIYATACIIGGALFLILIHFDVISEQLIQIITILLIVIIRMISVRYHLHFPKFYR